MYAYKQLNGIIPHAFINKRDQYEILTGNESVPKIMINNTTNLFFKTAVSILQISSHNSFRVLFDKIASVFEKYIYILVSEMASPRNQNCANCIGTLSFVLRCKSDTVTRSLNSTKGAK